ncbi:hypothetical protein [Rhodocista pekingensis]|uniref:Uncharacterized protein n=1 Tax=Rhodocista pekingensis TaxID=201185 RepID=A0ABW2KTQ3_9PROT
MRPPAPARPLLLTAVLLAGLVALPAPWTRTGQAADGAFVAGTEDLPLMPGFVLLADETVVFDKPGGRIVQAVAAGPAPLAEVRAFYDGTLPQLGWKPAGAGRWLREGERLELRLDRAQGRTLVRLTLAPQDRN